MRRSRRPLPRRQWRLPIPGGRHVVPDRGGVALQRQASATERTGAIAQRIACIAQCQRILPIRKPRCIGIGRRRCGHLRARGCRHYVVAGRRIGVATLPALDHRAMRKRIGMRGGLGSCGHAGKCQQHRCRQPAARVHRRSIQPLIPHIAGKPARSAMGMLPTAGIQVHWFHRRLTPHWSGVKTDHRAIASHGPPEVYIKCTRTASAPEITRAKEPTNRDIKCCRNAMNQ